MYTPTTLTVKSTELMYHPEKHIFTAEVSQFGGAPDRLVVQSARTGREIVFFKKDAIRDSREGEIIKWQYEPTVTFATCGINFLYLYND